MTTAAPHHLIDRRVSRTLDLEHRVGQALESLCWRLLYDPRQPMPLKQRAKLALSHLDPWAVKIAEVLSFNPRCTKATDAEFSAMVRGRFEEMRAPARLDQDGEI